MTSSHRSAAQTSASNVRTTITTLRQQAGEMLRVADHLEATESFVSRYAGRNGGLGINPAGPRLVHTGGKLSAAHRRKISLALKARNKQRTTKAATAA